MCSSNHYVNSDFLKNHFLVSFARIKVPAGASWRIELARDRNIGQPLQVSNTFVFWKLKWDQLYFHECVSKLENIGLIIRKMKHI